MKKIFSVVMAAVLLMTGCVKENISHNGNEGKVQVTFTATLPMQVEISRAGQAGEIDEIVYVVYNNETPMKKLTEGTLTVTNKTANLNLDLIKGETYNVAFWAAANSVYTFNKDAATVEADYSNVLSNDETLDAFYAVVPDMTISGPVTQQVKLSCPFAQINLGAPEQEFDNAELLGVEVKKSQVTFTGVANQLDLFSGEVSGSADVTFKMNTLPTEVLTVNAVPYKYVAFNYVFAGDTGVADLTYTLAGDSKELASNTVPAVNFKRNYRTNIIGRLITGTAGFDITIEPGDLPDYDNVFYQTVSSASGLQEALDAATDGATIKLTANVDYGVVYLGRPTKSNNTVMTCETHNFTTTDAAAFKAHLGDGAYHTTPKYTTTLKNVTIIGAEGATIAGLVATSGHTYGTNVHDYVLDVDKSGSVYYCTLHMENIKFQNVAFTGKIDINTSDAESTYNGVTFEGCTFTTGGTASSNGAAIRYYNESATNGHVKNIVVKDCKFNNCYQGVYVQNVNGVTVADNELDTTGHNAVGVQGTCDLKAVVITNNEFKNIGDRVIRFNNVGADSQITIQHNTATNSGDDAGEVIKATSIAAGVTTNVGYNNWNGGVVVNPELRDTAVEVATAAELAAALSNSAVKEVAFANDITVDKWIMFSETKNVGNGNIITVEMNGLKIYGNGHTLTVNSIESAGNGNLLFDDASNLNIYDLTINRNCGGGAIGLKSGVISGVNFVGGGYGIHPGAGEVLIENCTFATADGDAVYFEQERDNLTINKCTFNQLPGENVVLLRGDVKFTNNIVNSGRTVNIVSGSPVVTGNNFNDVRLKVYPDATATVSGNIINNLVFNTTTYSSTFTDNTLSAEAQAALNAATKN